MRKAETLLQILTHEYTKPLQEKYGKLVVQAAALEERIRVLMEFGMIDKSKELNVALVGLLEDIKKEFDADFDS